VAVGERAAEAKAADLLADLTRRGFTLSLVGCNLRVSPGSDLSDGDRRRIKAHRAELIRLAAPPWEHQEEADRLLAQLRQDIARAEREQRDGRSLPLMKSAVRTWVDVCEGYVRNYAVEAARGWDALALLRAAAKRAREAARRGSVDAPSSQQWFGAPRNTSMPCPPAGARLFFGGEDSRPSAPEESVNWCWEGAPEWYDAGKYPPPDHTLRLAPWSPLRCSQCVKRDLRFTWQQFSNGTMHLRCDCGVCGKYVKHVTPPPKNPEVEYWTTGKCLE
jgi:hypothetical protein